MFEREVFIPTRRDTIIGTILAVALGLATALFFGIAFTISFLLQPAQGHEWYPVDCCSGHDCKPVPDSRVERTASGDYLVDGSWLFSRSNKTETRPSLSGRYHLCVPNPNERPKCIFVPADGS